MAALSREVIEQFHTEYAEQFRSLSVPRVHAAGTLLWDARYSLLTVALAGFGRALVDVARDAGAEVRDGHGLVDAAAGRDGVRLAVDGLGDVEARYAIGADGRCKECGKPHSG